MTKPERLLLEFLTTKLHAEKSDEQIAKIANTTPEEVAATRIKLKLPEPAAPPTMKEAARLYLANMSLSEKRDFLSSIPKKELWEMAEGRAHSTEDQTVKHILPTPIMSIDAPVKTDVLNTKV